jgi:thiol-disulfide isomerase/thioredoxin
MKNGTIFSLLLLIVCLFWQCSAAGAGSNEVTTMEPENADITFQINGMGAQPVRLIGIVNEQQFLVDEVASDGNGKAVFKKDKPYDQGLYFVLLSNNSNFQVMITEDQTFTMTSSLNNLAQDMQVEGSLDNQLLYDNIKYEAEYQQQLTPLNNQRTSLDPESAAYADVEKQRQALIDSRRDHLQSIFDTHPNSFFVKFKQAGQNPVLRKDLPNEAQVAAYRMEFWDGVDFSDERLLHTPVIMNKVKRYFEELTPQQPDSIIASLERLVEQLPTIDNSQYYQYFVNWVAINYEPTKTSLMDSEAIFVHMVKNHFTYERAFWSDSTNTYALQLRADEMANSLVGQPGPNVKVPDVNGTPQELYQLKAPYIIVYLYNPDCEHCQEQTPVLANLHRKWQQQSPPLADVYAIAIDTERDLWLNYTRKIGATWTNVFDPSNKSIYKTYFVDVTPEVYVLGPDRKIIAKNLNVNQIEEVIRRDQEKR